MIISLTGTPGTGKTSVAKSLRQEGFEVIGLTDFVKSRGLGEQKKDFEVDVPAMIDALEDEIKEGEDTVIEGHLSHHFEADFCVVLRCNPEELEERLGERDYSEQKVSENIESEILDIVLSEAVEVQENVVEIDTTGKNSGDVAEEILDRTDKGKTDYGKIDWTEYL